LTVFGVKVSEAPRKSLEVPSLGSSEKIFGTSNLYQLKHSVHQRRQFEENLACFLEYFFTSRLIHLSLITAQLLLRSTFSPRLTLSLSLSLSLSLYLSLSTAPALLSNSPPPRRSRSSSSLVIVLLVRPACEAGHPSSSVGCRS
jgi:hypothetical protein